MRAKKYSHILALIWLHQSHISKKFASPKGGAVKKGRGREQVAGDNFFVLK
jgi:hypothetical protein